MSTEAASYWAQESAKTILVGGGIGAGVLGGVGALFWNEKASCLPGTSGLTCPKQADLAGITFYSGAGIGVALAFVVLALAGVALFVGYQRHQA